MAVIITNNIENECKTLLSLYMDTSHIKKVILNNYPGLSETKQKNVPPKIKSYISQGIKFYEETDDSILAAPLTLFYSILNFSKAIFYINRPNESIANAHGLSFKGNDSLPELGATCAKVDSNGTFVNLVKVTGDHISKEDTLIAKDIFAQLPELCNVYALRYLEEPNVYLMQKHVSNNEYYKLIYQTERTKHIDFTLPSSNGLLISTMGTSTNVFLSEACSQKDFENSTYMDVYGNYYLTCGMKDADGYHKISKIVLLYYCYYIFSMLVRYDPEKWRQFCDTSDSSIINKLVIDLRREMLVEVLQWLSGKQYIFATKMDVQQEDLDISDLWEKLKKEILRDKIVSGKNPLASLYE